MRCKFCQLEFRPFEEKSIVTMKDYAIAERELIRKEDKTCSICFKICHDEKSRKKHELRHKIPRTKSYKCSICKRSYSNKSDLDYHKLTKHEFEKAPKINVVNGEQILCEDCETTFTNEKSMVRHRSEVHKYTKKNLDYAPLDELLFICRECDATFLRQHNLKRHTDTVHRAGKIVTLVKCPSCGAEFSRKDKLTRHLRKKICEL